MGGKDESRERYFDVNGEKVMNHVKDGSLFETEMEKTERDKRLP